MPKRKQAVKDKIISGEINVIVGTHAIIQKDTQYHRLGLVITDEQSTDLVLLKGRH